MEIKKIVFWTFATDLAVALIMSFIVLKLKIIYFKDSISMQETTSMFLNGMISFLGPVLLIVYSRQKNVNDKTYMILLAFAFLTIIAGFI